MVLWVEGYGLGVEAHGRVEVPLLARRVRLPNLQQQTQRLILDK